MINLKELGEPSEFWEYFGQITKIPRCSQNEERVRNYIREEAEKLGFKTQVDNIGNLVVRIPARSQQEKKGILQCHMDMVCEKNEAVTHDFSKDPLKLEIIEDKNEKWITAIGTTLGADNGVGICYILTLMKKIKNKELGFDTLALDLLFTVDEEQGLRGAFEIDSKLIDGDFLINLDSEEDTSVTIGCAGGIVTFYYLKTDRININQIKSVLIPIKLDLLGLLGGHSGVDIHLGRGNAIKIISQILSNLNDKFSIHLCSIDGGNRTNAIPREVSTIFYVEKENVSEIKIFIKEHFNNIKILYDSIEPNLEIIITKLENFSNETVLVKEMQDKILSILNLMPCGPLSMHPRIKDLVFSSTNLAVINTREQDIEIKLSQRSLSEYFKYLIWENVKSLLELSDLEIQYKIDSDYPGWNPNFNSRLLNNYKEVYRNLVNEDLIIKAIHAGLECGILKKKFPQMEMISIGPKNEGAHSPDEKLKIKSIENVWKLLINLLQKLS